MKRILYFLCAVLLFGCEKPAQDEQVVTNPKIGIIDVNQQVINDSVKGVLWNDPVFIKLCDETDLRPFIKDKSVKKNNEVYWETLKQLVEYGKDKNIPDISAYRIAYYNEKYTSTTNLTKSASSAEIDLYCQELASLFQTAYRLFQDCGGSCYETFSYSVIWEAKMSKCYVDVFVTATPMGDPAYNSLPMSEQIAIYNNCYR